MTVGDDIACEDSAAYQDAVRNGADRMPAFPALTDADIGAILS